MNESANGPRRLALIATLAVAVALTLGACATQDEVRATCANHGGVSSVNGNAARKFVACRDGYYRTIR